jgi:hypothetical protein
VDHVLFRLIVFASWSFSFQYGVWVVEREVDFASVFEIVWDDQRHFQNRMDEVARQHRRVEPVE